jgi:hypothetical protein
MGIIIGASRLIGWRLSVKVGDLVRYGSTTPENRTLIQKVVGTVINTSGIMMCGIGSDPPYEMGSVEIMWSDGRGINREVFASLEVISD